VQPSTPLWISLVMTVLPIMVPVVAWLVFQRFARRSARELIAPSAIFVALWIVVAYTLSAREFFSALGTGPVPAIAYAFVPLVIGYVGFLTIPSIRHVVDEIPLHWMIGLQLYRAAGFVFLVEWWLGALPGAFALPAGIGDMAIGLAAPFVATRLERGSPRAREMAIRWNALGIADLVVAVAMGLLTTPGPLHILALNSSSRAITTLPLVLVPTIAVPFSFLLHFISLHRLMGRVRPSLAIPRAA
jgi:hypothetical protein